MGIAQSRKPIAYMTTPQIANLVFGVKRKHRKAKEN